MGRWANGGERDEGDGSGKSGRSEVGEPERKEGNGEKAYRLLV